MRETMGESAVSDMGSKNLWKAVLDQAVKDAHGHMGTYEYRKDARAWFRSPREDIGSFRWICEVLDLDPQVTLARLDNEDNNTPPRMRAFRYEAPAFMAGL